LLYSVEEDVSVVADDHFERVDRRNFKVDAFEHFANRLRAVPLSWSSALCKSFGRNVA
jgi:hypothetical protein